MDNRAYIPRYGVVMTAYNAAGEPEYHRLSRQIVLFCVERRKAWRMLQSRAGIANEDYLNQKELLAALVKGNLSLETFLREEAVVN